MNCKIEIIVTKFCIDNTVLDDDLVFKKLAVEMVSKLPLSEIEKFINFKIIDPDSEESHLKLNDIKTSMYEKEKILSLKKNEQLLYLADFKL
jgi:hypothetical protein